jgi:hypothetical protein
MGLLGRRSRHISRLTQLSAVPEVLLLSPGGWHLGVADLIQALDLKEIVPVYGVGPHLGTQAPKSRESPGRGAERDARFQQEALTLGQGPGLGLGRGEGSGLRAQEGGGPPLPPGGAGGARLEKQRLAASGLRR